MFTFLDKDFFVSRKGKETGALVFLETRFITFFGPTRVLENQWNKIDLRECVIGRLSTGDKLFKFLDVKQTLKSFLDLHSRMKSTLKVKRQ